MKISALFDQTKDIHRPIEKVITYGASQEARLESEIAEYIVTESIEEQFESLLSKMQTAMESGGQNEVGVWVSGFYGSGKSSFTKYLGFALDDSVRVGDSPFIDLLQDRLHKPTTKALLSTLASKYPAAIVMLDLASEMIAGATMKEVSTVLYYKVLQWAGYSRNLKVAAFERKLKKDGRYDEFLKVISDKSGADWSAIQNDPLVVDSLVPEVAHQMYPEFFRSTSTFNTDASDIITFEDDRVAEMLDIVKEATGREYVVFVVDEVGQYVGSRDHLITNLDGLAKNLKNIGDGKAWIIGTAQQTLTEDDPRAALNAPELFKLEARFPIKIDLESRDIKEICYRRLLGKSTKGEEVLSELFDQHGQALRHHTKLLDARFYDAELDKEAFVNLYPFLPAHFDILLHLLGVLAKRTGGIGLRSAIKIVQDILIEGPDESDPVAEKPLGWLITTVTLYDALERDIRSSTGTVRSIYEGINKAVIRYPDSDLHQAVAKTVGLLQILDNLPITAHNVASLIHPAVDASSGHDEVDKAIQDLINDTIVPFGEKDGFLCFFSEKLNDIDQERGQIPLRAMETRRIFNESLREAFAPLPAVRLHGSLAVETGLKAMSGSLVSSLAGDRNSVQTLVSFVAPANYDTERTKLVEESRQRSSLSTVFLLGRISPDIDEKVAEVYRCREISQRYRNDPDQEVKEYCAGQADRATKLGIEIQHSIRQQLVQGSFVFRGQTTAVESLSNDLLESCKKHLADVANQVFDRYSEAPARADTTLAEKFLRAGNLKAITSTLDPLGLVQIQGGTPRVDCDHKALTSIKDYLDRNGTVEGRRLTDHFTGAPFGWSQDTLRYMIAALLVAGEVKLKVSGREVTVNGQQAIEALRTNNAFKPVGVALRDERPSNEVLVRASDRLTDLVGDTIIPHEQDISKAAAKHFSQVQHQIGPLAEKLDNLSLPGAEKIKNLSQELADIMLTDASDAPQRLGGEESSLYDSLKWASLVNTAFSQGMENTIRQLQVYRNDISALPNTGIPGRLQADLEEDLKTVQDRLGNEDFHKYATDYNSLLRTIKGHVSDATKELAENQKKAVKDAQEDLTRLPDWSELNSEEQSDVFARLEELIIEAPDDIKGLKMLINKDYEITQRASELKTRIQQMGQKRRLERLQEEKKKAEKEGKKKLTRSVTIPATKLKLEQLTELITQLQKIKDELEINSDIEVSIAIEEKDNNGV